MFLAQFEAHLLQFELLNLAAAGERELVDELLADSSLSSMPEWIHIVGNADYVHEIVDSVTTEAEALGLSL